MEEAKTARKAVRASFTRTFNALNIHLKKVPIVLDDVKVGLQLLEEKSVELEDLNRQIFSHMVNDSSSETEMATELDVVDDYKTKILKARLDVTSAAARANPSVPTREGEVPREPPPADQRTELRRSFLLPKIELKKFGGDIREWLQFWSQFKKIHEDATIDKEDKFQYLIQAMEKGSRASELVNSYPPTDKNYDKVIAGLKHRFGKDELLVEVYVRELLELILNNAKKLDERLPLSRVYDRLESHLRALESLGVTSDKCATILYPLVESSLPEEILRAWQRHGSAVSADGREDRLDNLMTFLQSEVDNEERVALAVNGFGTTSGKNKMKEDKCEKKKGKYVTDTDIPTAAGLLTMKDNKIMSCIFCGENHESVECYRARDMTYEDRQRCVKDKRGCFRCLKVGHGVKTCYYKQKCPWCSRKHVLIMCREMQSGKGPDESRVVVDEDKCVQRASLTAVLKNPQVFLQTLRVKLFNGGREHVVRAVLDSCSHRSYILESAVKKMGYQSIGKQRMVHLLFGGIRTDPQYHQGYLIYVGNLSGTYECNFTALSKNNIVENISTVDDGPWNKELCKKGIYLSDFGYSSEPISILIGADVLGKLQTGNLFDLKSGPTAIETRLGWTLIGKKPQFDESREDAAMVVTSMFVKEAEVSDLWNLDVMGITDPVETASKKMHLDKVKQDFLQSVIKNDDNRYEIRLPWKENHPPLPNNKSLAEKRLMTVTDKLKKNNLFEIYGQVIQEWYQEGIIEKVDDLSDFGYYLPHRPVIKEHGTTRVRPVFDASAKTKDSFSLNQCLEVGPNLIEFIPSLLIRFRERKIGVISDIKKAFLQISVSLCDRDVLRFLWWDDGDPSKLQVYRHARVVFGVSSSPFLLGAVIEQHLNQVLKSEKSEATKSVIEKLSKSFYVDNCVTSVDSEAENNFFESVSREIMSRGGFDLRCWEHSSDENSNKDTSVLGLTWDKSDDTLRLNAAAFDEVLPARISKRVILSASHRVFDPIGFSCPVMLCPKILLQEIWLRQLDWDAEVDAEVKNVFVDWYKDLVFLKQLKIPRRMISCSRGGESLTFHVFVDASQTAYAAVIFARSQVEANVEISLVQAKSRVAPSKKITIPRLELLAAAVGVRLMNSVTEALTVDVGTIYYWTDSSTVLTWIQRNSQWATFVWNRVDEIRRHSSIDQWRHVPGDMNPADLPSRGCSTRQLLMSRWWEGPQWLKRPPQEWPNLNYHRDEDSINSELKRTGFKQDSADSAVNVISVTKDLENEKISDLFGKYFSSFNRIVRMTGWMLRFVHNSRNRLSVKKCGDLSSEEISAAECYLLRIIQRETFKDEKDERIINLGSFTDETGLIRLNTIIRNRQDAADFLCPIVLDSRHPLVTALIEYRHRNLNHAGTQITLNNLREKFWILKGRRAVRAVINKCVICKGYSAKHLESSPAALPENRVRDAKVFEITGVDYAGPVYLRGGEKAWIGLFTCAVYRAIHLELITTLSTEGFIEAFRRFIARRDRPSVMYSDNGTNFVGTNNLFLKLDWKRITEFGAVRQIQWKFNPPSAAWWGGWWERLVRVVKDLLRKVLKKACLTYEELQTVLCDCESTINSRPITYLADDPFQLSPLTPSMFLREIDEGGVPDLDQIERVDFKRRLAYRQKIRDDLRKRFRIEYLGQLFRRQRRGSKDCGVKVGDIVLIGNDNDKRLNWPLALVTKLIAGKDEVVRVVKLRTATGEIVRPIQRIFPLEIPHPVEADKFRSVDCESVESQVKPQILSETRDVSNPAVSKNNQIFTTRSGRLVKAPERLML